MKNRTTGMLVVWCCLLSGPIAARAAEPASRPADDSVEAVKARVVSVKGVVESSPAGKDEWTRVKKGQELGGLTVIRQGFGAKLVLDFADRSRVVVTGGAKMGIRECLRKGKHIRTRVGLKYGSMNANVDSSRGTNDFRIKTPVATAAAKGSQIQTGMSEKGMGVKGQAGIWKLNNPKGSSNVTPGSQTDGNHTPSNQILAGKLDTLLGTAGGGLTKAERLSLLQNGQTGMFNLQGAMGSGPGPVNNHVTPLSPSSRMAVWSMCSGNWTESASVPGTGSWTGSGTWTNGRRGGQWSVNNGTWIADGSGTMEGNWRGTITGEGFYGLGEQQPTQPFRAVGFGSGTGTKTGTEPDSGTIDSGHGIGVFTGVPERDGPSDDYNGPSLTNTP